MKTYYELLEVSPDASADDIKRAFRREIAKYHPDKVQHLGKEFQEIAASKAAELTHAYKTLSDAGARADYDAALAAGEIPPGAAAQAPAAAASRPAAQPEPAAAYRPPPTPPSGRPKVDQFSTERQGVSDFLRRAAIARFLGALGTEFGKYDQVSLAGFDVVAFPAPRFWSIGLPPRILVRVVEAVDAKAVADTWGLAARMKKDNNRDLCIFLMGPALASAGELAKAIADGRKKPMPAGGKLVLIPVNITNWSAHVPTDAPPLVKSLLARLNAK